MSVIRIVAYCLLLTGVSSALYRICSRILRSYLFNWLTIVGDLDSLLLGPSGSRLQGTTVIAGNSVAGLLTARILADYCNEIVIIDPETDFEGRRSRVGQAHHLHGWQGISVVAMRKMFPNFDGEAPAFGVRIQPERTGFTRGDVDVYFPPGTVLPPNIYATRMSFERLLRYLTRSYSKNIRFIAGTITGITAAADEKSISSVTVRLPTNDTEEYRCALFVDCTGSTAVGTKLLRRASSRWGPYKRTTYDPKVAYATAMPYIDENAWKELADTVPYERSDASGCPEKLVRPRALQGGLDGRLFAIQRGDSGRIVLFQSAWAPAEGALPTSYDEWESIIRSLLENTGRYKHTDEQWFYRFLNILRTAVVNENEESAENCKFRHYKMGPCYVTHFEHAFVPSNFLALGDARVRINPVFGQGISKALMDVVSLSAVLRSLSVESSRRAEFNDVMELPNSLFHDVIKRANPRVIPIFVQNKAVDYLYPNTIHVPGETPDTGYFARLFTDMMLELVAKDADIRASFIPVYEFMAPPSDMAAPWIIWRGIKLWWNTRSKFD